MAAAGVLVPVGRVARRQPRAAARRAPPSTLPAVVARPGLGTALALLFLAAITVYGAIRGGEYDAFVASEGRPIDIAARLFGFGIKAVTIAGERELTETEILGAAGIGPTNSLLFLDVEAVRARLKAVALVKDVSVTKLYPNRVMIDIEERQPFALWQKDGVVQIVAADGTPIDSMRDSRFAQLPLVVGDGANSRLAEYQVLLDAAGELQPRIRAGMLIAGRRWTLKMVDGVEVELPETDPAGAVARLIALQREDRILDKDIVSLDFRQAGRMVVRLTDEAASARAETLAHKGKKAGST
jgi:cell division protein FtsQ